MPLYEYECQADGSRFEVIQKFSDPPVTTCPNCGGAVRKLLSSPAIQFKGSGWYITDYARKGQKDPGSDKSDKSDKADKSSSSTTSTTAASTSESKTSSPASTPATSASASPSGTTGSSS